MIVLVIIYLLFILYVEYRIIMGYRFVNPIKTIAWMLSVFFIPIIGVLFFYVVGGDKRHSKQIGKRENYKNNYQANLDIKTDSSDEGLKTLISNLSSLPVYYENKVELFSNAQSKFERLFQDLETAKESIYVIYYAIIDDDLGVRFKNLLIQKAKEGLEIKLIYDGYGSHKTKKSYFEEMVSAGIGVKAFFPLKFPKIFRSVNYRNHKKLVIIDNKIGYIGGINLDVVYVNGFDWGIWKDFHMKITGSSAVGLLEIFADDWYRITGENVIQKSGDVFENSSSAQTDAVVQVIASEPDGAFSNNKLMIIKALASAKKSVWLETPYLVPPAGVLDALKTAALSGLDVRVIVPRRSDSKVVGWITRSYIADLLSCGVKVYLFKPGILHSKIILIDYHITIAGSTNLDVRSLELNFEINAVLYDKEINSKVREIVLDDISNSEIVQAEKWKMRTNSDKFKESFFRLFSPLM